MLPTYLRLEVPQVVDFLSYSNEFHWQTKVLHHRHHEATIEREGGAAMGSRSMSMTIA